MISIADRDMISGTEVSDAHKIYTLEIGRQTSYIWGDSLEERMVTV